MNAIDGYATDDAMRQVDDGTAGQKFDASARTWHRIGTEQTRLGTHYAQAVKAGTAAGPAGRGTPPSARPPRCSSPASPPASGYLPPGGTLA